MSAAGGLLGNFVTVETPAEGIKRHRILHFNPAHLVSVEYRAGEAGGLASGATVILTFVGGLVVEFSGAEAEVVYAQLVSPQDTTVGMSSVLPPKRGRG